MILTIGYILGLIIIFWLYKVNWDYFSGRIMARLNKMKLIEVITSYKWKNVISKKNNNTYTRENEESNNKFDISK